MIIEERKLHFLMLKDKTSSFMTRKKYVRYNAIVDWRKCQFIAFMSTSQLHRKAMHIANQRLKPW